MIESLNKAFDSRIRLGIMSMLRVNDELTFNTLKETLAISDGNLASHITGLEKLAYIKVHKQFIGKKPNTSYTLTPLGKQAFDMHLNALENLLKKHN